MRLIPAVMLLACLLCAPAVAAPSIPDQKLNLTTFTLPNGLLVAVVENHAVPLVTIEVAVHNGAMNEPPELNGLSHLYEHMFFKGNAVIPDQEAYMKRLRQLGALWNGTTNTERVNYFFTMGSHNTEAGLKFMADAIVTPRFNSAELVKERQVVLGEFDRFEANPDYHLYHAVDRQLWYKYPSYKDPLGDRQSIGNATVEQMTFMQRVYYVPNNSLLVVAGDVKASDIKSLAARYFGGWKRGPNPFEKHPLVKHPPLQKSSVAFVRQPVRTVTVSLSWHGPSTAADMRSAVVADVFSFAANQDGSRLQKALVDSGLAVHAQLYYSTLSNTGPIGLRMETPPDKALQAIEAALKEARQFGQADYLTEDEWRNAQTLLAVGDLYDRERQSEFAHTLSFWWSVAAIEDYLQYIPRIRSYTRQDGAAYAARYIVDKPLVMGVMTSPEDEKSHGVTEASVQQALLKSWPAAPPVGRAEVAP